MLIAPGRAGLGWDEREELLTRESGLLALAGSEEMRDTHGLRSSVIQAATARWRSTTTGLRHYLGQLDSAEAIVFTGGVGENAPTTRAAAVRREASRHSP